MTSTEILASWTANLVEEEKHRAAMLSAFQAGDAMRCVATASQLRHGPRAKKGARSHQAWRDMLAEREMLAAVQHGVAMTMYAGVAGEEEGE